MFPLSSLNDEKVFDRQIKWNFGFIAAFALKWQSSCDRDYGLQNQKYFLPFPLQKMFANFFLDYKPL